MRKLEEEEGRRCFMLSEHHRLARRTSVSEFQREGGGGDGVSSVRRMHRSESLHWAR